MFFLLLRGCSGKCPGLPLPRSQAAAEGQSISGVDSAFADEDMAYNDKQATLNLSHVVELAVEESEIVMYYVKAAGSYSNPFGREGGVEAFLQSQKMKVVVGNAGMGSKMCSQVSAAHARKCFNLCCRSVVAA